MSLYSGFAAEGAGISGVLCDFHLFDLLSKRSTISVGVFISHLLQGIHRLDVVDGERCFVVDVAYLVPYLPVTPTSGIRN